MDTTCFLYTNRLAIRPFTHRPDALIYGGSRPAAGTTEDLVAVLRNKHIRYLVETPTEDRSFRLLVHEVQSRYAALLAQVYRGADPRFAVSEVALTAVITDAVSIGIRAFRGLRRCPN
jgi:hypothetical protein